MGTDHLGQFLKEEEEDVLMCVTRDGYLMGDRVSEKILMVQSSDSKNPAPR